MKFPNDIFYTQDHEWIKFSDGFAIVGITDFAQKELGDIVFVDIESVGQKLDENSVFGTIEAVKTVSDLFLPINAEVLEINPAIIYSPELINSEPYDRGWIVKIKPLNAEDRTNLLSNEEYQALIG
nr:glycine cleavage system protein GcvH [uncultured Fluviicola sp.]